MMKVIFILFIIENTVLTAIFILRRLRHRKKPKGYRVKKLSEMHGKEFGDYIDYLRKDL